MAERTKNLTVFLLIKIFIICSIIPFILIQLYLNELIAFSTLKVSIVIFIILFGIIPIIFKLSWPFQRSVLFLNFVSDPRNAEYSSPEKYNLPGSRNLYVKTDDDLILGTWQILPENLINISTLRDESFYDEALLNGQPVILYMHGNSGNRAADHRIVLYQFLRKFFHVFAFDYRGYGDSSDVEVAEPLVVRDAMFMIQWVRNKTNGPVYVWGHSLGTGVSSHALDLLSTKKDIEINGLILESPFNNLYDEIAEHPFARPFRDLPWFDYLIPKAMYESGLQFETDKHILKFNAPVIILHAEDDGVVPFHLGLKLYESTRKNRTKEQGNVDFFRFDKKFKYGHKWISKAPELTQIVTDFLLKTKTITTTKLLQNGTVLEN